MAVVLNEILFSTVWKDIPLTQAEIKFAAEVRYKALRRSVALLLWKALKVAREKGCRSKFRKIHLKWKEFNKEWLSWEVDFFFFEALIASSDAMKMREISFEARRYAIKSWLSYMGAEQTV